MNHHRFLFLFPRSRRDALAGALLTLMIIAAVAPGISLLPAGLLGWIAALLLSDRLGRRQRIQCTWLIGLGIAGVAWGALHGAPLDLAQILAGNQGLISLLAAVSFLRLVTRPDAGNCDTAPPRGRKALWRTLIGVHLFGAVINLSTIVILGDRMATRGRLGKRRALALSRGFAAAAFWSPFFAAMAAVLTYAPGAQPTIVVVAGLPMAALSLWLTAREIDPENPTRGAPFVGYPMRFNALWIPGLLVAIVLIFQILVPRWSILAIIALSAPLLTAVILAAREGRGAWPSLKGHIQHNLAGFINELALFLSAGILAAGLTSLSKQYGDWLPFDRFGPSQATLALLVMVGCSAFAVHPLITIAACGVWLAPLHPDPNLLAITLLMGWGIGIPVNPLSGLHLVIQGRYGIDGYAFPRWNRVYTLKCLGAGIGLLYLYGELLGVSA